MRLLLFMSTLLLLLLGGVRGDADVSFRLNRFENPENKLQNGKYCNDDKSPCIMKFSFKFKQPISYKFTTDDVTASSIDYVDAPDAIATSSGVQSNPFPTDTHITNAIDLVEFSIVVYHFPASGTPDRCTVAKFKTTANATLGTQTYILADGHSTFNLTSTIMCRSDYYGNCTVYCVENEHYFCDNKTGDRICKPGWAGPDCATSAKTPCPAPSVGNSSYTPSNVTSFNEGQQVVVACDSGFLPPSTTLKCLKNGTWNATVVCKPEECTALLPPTNGTISPSTSGPTPLGGVVNFSCQPGFRLVGSNRSTCSSGGIWKPAPATCSLIRCGSISAPSHGSVNCSSREVGATATFSCLPGYSLNGTTVTTCLQDGQWDSQPPICTVNLCPDLNLADPIKNGYGYYSSTPPPRHPGNTYNQGCQGGYSLIGVNTRLCLNNGTWDGQKITCLKKCDRLTGFRNGTIVYSSGTNVPVEGSTATFQCTEGLQLQGQETATCTPNGTWSTEIPSCVPVTGCSVRDLPALTNVTVEPQLSTEKVQLGFVLTLSCPGPDYFINSSVHYLACIEGMWNTTKVTTISCLPFWNTAQIKQRLLTSGLGIVGGVLSLFAMLVLTLGYIDGRMRTGSKTVKIIQAKLAVESTQAQQSGRRRQQAAKSTLPLSLNEVVMRETKDTMCYSNPVFVEDF